MTRRVNPDAEVNGSHLARIAARILALRGASCAHQVTGAEAILAACGVSVAADEVPVSGRMASAVLDDVDRAISR